MAKARRRIDYAQFLGGPGFELNEVQRAEVESEYGSVIPPTVWEEIFEATSRYTIPEAALQSSPSLEEITGPLNAFLESARSLRATIAGPTLLAPNPLDIQTWMQTLSPVSEGNLYGLYADLLDWSIAYTNRIQELHNAGRYIGPKSPSGNINRDYKVFGA